MARDYVPRPDAEFLTWIQAYQAYATAHMADLGLTVDDLTTLGTRMTTFQTGLNNHTAAQNAAQAARQAKDAGRDDLESLTRALTRRIQANPTTTDADRAGLGITLQDPQPTIAAPPPSRPVGTVDTAQRLRHEIRWRDELSGKRAKPAGTSGCEVWVKVGEPAADPSQLRFLGFDTRSGMVAEYNGEDGGKQAHYWLRWISSRGEKGPWSETVSATIPN